MTYRYTVFALVLVHVIFMGPRLAAQPAIWESRGIGGGGALFSPSISPHDADNIYVACDMTDLFHTTDQGASWVVLPFMNFCAVRDSRIEFTSDPDILYSIHFEFFSDVRKPGRSTDGGRTWVPLPADPTDGGTFSVYADPHRTDRLVVSSYTGIFFSGDGGSTFRSIHSSSASYAAAIGGVYWDGDTIVVATPRGLLVSFDAGSSFALQPLGGIPSGEGIVSFTGARGGGVLRFFCVTYDVNNIWPGMTGAEHPSYAAVYRLDFGTGADWQLSTTGIDANDHPFFVGMSEGDVDIAYLAGGNSATSYPIVLKTADGGMHWSETFNTRNNANIFSGWSGYRGDNDWWFGEYALGFDVALDDPDVAVITDLGFPHKTTDGGVSWQAMYVDPADQNPPGIETPKGKAYRGIGMEPTAAWWIQWKDPAGMFVGMTDITAMRSTDGGNAWSKNFTGINYNTVYCVRYSPQYDWMLAAASSVHDMYESTYLTDARIDGGKGAVLYSTDGGTAWLVLHDFQHPVVWLQIDPANPKRIYASVVHSSEGGIYVSDDADRGSASTWRRLAVPPRTEGHPLGIRILGDGTLVCSYSGRRNASGAFTASSGVFVSTDGGGTWTDRSDAGMRYWMRDIVIDPLDPDENTWYACVYSGWGGAPNGLGGLYRSRNRGLQWTRISALDRVPSCAVNPLDGNECYVSTESDGLWFSKNIDAEVPQFVRVEGYPFQHPQRMFFNPFDPAELWVTSFGNGLRVARTATTESRAVPGSAAFDLALTPNPAHDRIAISFRGLRSHSAIVTVTDILGRVVMRRQTEMEASTPESRFLLDVSVLKPGVYFLTGVSGAEVRTVRFLLR